eukprot:TRINITY_DN35675_c0_g1_i1.p1 TRINITY_DN35675_c0_g1~~TRINITY_DN35675_c0_g1_i1.p1  ORF type:complete len:262 (+),score=28.32 TRINITY_DN35675_c0_g1_i1:367-1152(+)
MTMGYIWKYVRAMRQRHRLLLVANKWDLLAQPTDQTDPADAIFIDGRLRRVKEALDSYYESMMPLGPRRATFSAQQKTNAEALEGEFHRFLLDIAASHIRAPKDSIKAVVVGPSQVGKTALCYMICGSDTSGLFGVRISLRGSFDLALCRRERVLSVELVDITGYGSSDLSDWNFKDVDIALVVWDMSRPETYDEAKTMADKAPWTQTPAKVFVGMKADVMHSRLSTNAPPLGGYQFSVQDGARVKSEMEAEFWRQSKIDG